VYQSTFADVICNFTVAFSDPIIFIAGLWRGEIDIFTRSQIASPELVAEEAYVTFIVIRGALTDFWRIDQAHVIRIETLRVGLASLISNLLAHKALAILAGRRPDFIVTLIRILPMHTVSGHKLPEILRHHEPIRPLLA
jgi:hypothetical protein